MTRYSLQIFKKNHICGKQKSSEGYLKFIFIDCYFQILFFYAVKLPTALKISL